MPGAAACPKPTVTENPFLPTGKANPGLTRSAVTVRACTRRRNQDHIGRRQEFEVFTGAAATFATSRPDHVADLSNTATAIWPPSNSSNGGQDRSQDEVRWAMNATRPWSTVSPPMMLAPTTYRRAAGHAARRRPAHQRTYLGREGRPAPLPTSTVGVAGDPRWPAWRRTRRRAQARPGRRPPQSHRPLPAGAPPPCPLGIQRWVDSMST